MGQLSTEVSEIWNFFTFPDFVRNVRADLDVREAAGNLPDLKSVLSEHGYSAFVSRAMDFLAKTYRTCPEGLDWEKDEDWCRIVMRKAVDALRAGDMRRALTLVNNAVLVAPVDDPARCLNFVLHHRCFIMLMLGRPEDALSDMCLATQAGFPQHRMFIKHELTGHIYDALGDLEKAVNEFKKAMNLLDAMAEGSVPDQVALTKRAEGKYRDALKRHTDNGGGRKKRTREELRNVAPACGPSVPKAVGPPLTEAEEKSIKVVGGNGSFFVGLTNRIKEVDDLNCGPYTYNLVFKEDLSAGETVLVEKPFVTVLEEHFFADHCMVCLQWTDRPLPCKNCRNVVFCSTACEKQAASKHKPECGLLSHFFREQPEYPELAIVRQFPADDQFSCSLAILILRTILGQEISYWKDLLLKSDSDSTDEDCDDDGEGSSLVESGHPKYKNGFGSHDYIAIDSLSSGNAGMRDLSANILLAAEAAYVLAVIEGSDYWKNQASAAWAEAE